MKRLKSEFRLRAYITHRTLMHLLKNNLITHSEIEGLNKKRIDQRTFYHVTLYMDNR